MKNKKLNFANLISIFRLYLCLIGIFLLFLSFYHSTSDLVFFFNYRGIELFASIIIFLICAITDFLDGYIARKYYLKTDIGKFLDPLIDKVLINFYLLTLVCFTDIGKKYFFILVIYFLRDYFVDFSRLIFVKDKIIIAASIFGKIKTLFQIIFLTLFLISFYFDSNIFSQIVFYFAITSCFFSVFSMANYFSNNNFFNKIIFIKKNNEN